MSLCFPGTYKSRLGKQLMGIESTGLGAQDPAPQPHTRPKSGSPSVLSPGTWSVQELARHWAHEAGASCDQDSPHHP